MQTAWQPQSQYVLLYYKNVYIKKPIKTKINGKNCFITQMVRPLNNLSIEVSQDYNEIYGGFGGAKMSYVCSQSAKTNLSLEAIMLPNQKEILRIEVED